MPGDGAPVATEAVASPSFVAPTSLDQAVAELADDGAMVLGGGTATALLLKNDLIDPAKLVWLGRVAGLGGIEPRRSELRIGATTTLRQLALSPELPGDSRVIGEACAQVGNARVRAVATVGGAMVHGDPRQDLPPVLLALDATVCATGPNGSRTIPVGDLLVGFMETSLADDEILTEVVVPLPTGRRSTYARFTPNSDDDYPTVGVAATVTVDTDGTITGGSVALGGVGPTAFAVPGAGDLLIGRGAADVDLAPVVELAMASASPVDDQRGSEAYKRAMVGVWTTRALSEVLGRTGIRS